MDFQKYNIKKEKNKKKKNLKSRELLKNNNNHTHTQNTAFALKIGSFFLKSDSRL